MIGVIADVHGNYPALRAVLSSIDRLGCDTVISLGDLAGYYCMINEVVDLCRSRGIANVRGNHDQYLTSGQGCPRSTTANICLALQARLITNENMKYLDSSIDAFRNDTMWMVHGGWNDPLDEYVREFPFERFQDSPITLFASAHTHVQCMAEHEGKIYFNPGSVGQPRDGDPRAAFAIIDVNLGVSLYRVEYDIDQIAESMRQNGFEERFYENLYKGTAIRRFGADVAGIGSI